MNWRWMATQSIKRFLGRHGIVLLSHRRGERREVMDRMIRIRRQTALAIEFIEGWNLHQAVKQTQKVPGDIAEVGVFRGGSAMLICEVKGERTLHLFDTFEGLPEVDEVDRGHYAKGEWAGSLAEVQALLAPHRGVQFHVGFFPETAAPVASHAFSFVNLDVDTLRSTRDCLEFFHPRMSPGGMMLLHDYRTAPGVKQAVDEFMASRPEPIFELPGTQCLIVKAG